ncbi:MAG: DJ-1/PfpI family protein [Acetobacteraceae bacterium]|nr:DJ-1/PfpI family protein [Acetobacteraceae bacterium]
MASETEYPPTRRIGIFVFDDFEPLDVWGFVQAFTIARFLGATYADAGACPFQVGLIGETLEKICSFNGPNVVPDLTCAEALEDSPDVLMVPGGFGTHTLLDPDGNPEVLEARLDWLRAMDQRVEIMASVCTGSALLARAGLLDDMPAATNHAAFDWVATQGPLVLWDDRSRWVDAGKYVTSAGVSAGTDMAFHLVARLAGRAVAERAVLAAEYNWQRDPLGRS